MGSSPAGYFNGVQAEAPVLPWFLYTAKSVFMIHKNSRFSVGADKNILIQTGDLSWHYVCDLENETVKMLHL